MLAPRGRAGRARARRLEVRRRPRVRGAALPLGAAARGLPRADGAALRPAGQVITLHFLGGVTEIDGEPDTPGREFGVSVVGPLTSLAVGVAVLPLALLAPAARCWTSPSRAWPAPTSSSASSTWCRGCPSTAAGCCGRWSGSSPATPTRARSWPAGAAGSRPCWCWPTRSPGEFVLGVAADLTDYVFAFVIASFLWSGATAVDHVRAGTTPAAVPAGPDAGPPHARWSRTTCRSRRPCAAPRRSRPAASWCSTGRGSPPRSSTRRPCWPPPRTGGPGCRSARSPAPSSRALASPPTSSGEPLILAMQKAPATEYLLLDGDGSIFGVLVTEDVDRAFAAGI